MVFCGKFFTSWTGSLWKHHLSCTHTEEVLTNGITNVFVSMAIVFDVLVFDLNSSLQCNEPFLNYILINLQYQRNWFSWNISTRLTSWGPPHVYFDNDHYSFFVNDSISECHRHFVKLREFVCYVNCSFYGLGSWIVNNTNEWLICHSRFGCSSRHSQTLQKNLLIAWNNITQTVNVSKKTSRCKF